jgi:hypothetical protein
LNVQTAIIRSLSKSKEKNKRFFPLEIFTAGKDLFPRCKKVRKI